MVDIERLKALLAAATPGTWEAGLHSLHEEGSEYGDYSELFNGNQTIVGFFPKYDVELCAALHNAAPDLIAELEAAREVITNAAEAMRLLKQHGNTPRIMELRVSALAAIAAYEEKYG